MKNQAVAAQTKKDRKFAERVRTIEAPAQGYVIEWDDDPKDGGVAGFGLRVTAAGAKSFILNYRFADPADVQRKSSSYRYTIGPAKSSPRGAGWSVETARKEADRWRKLIDRGEAHPLAERRGRERAVKDFREAETFKEAIEDYIVHEAKGRKQNASADEVKRSVLKHCDAWCDRALISVNPSEIGKLLRVLRDGDDKNDARPYLANRLFSYLSTFFQWCAKPDVKKLPASPMIGMTRPWDGEEVRDRVFNDKEIKAIWKAADDIGGKVGALVKVLTLTGKRKTAVAAMRWGELSEDGLWSPPVDPRRKRRTKRLHGIPLPALAQRIIGRRPKDAVDSHYVFPGRADGSHLHPGTVISDDIKARSGVKDFYFHALRHTMETRLAELKVLPHIRDLLLDHAPTRGSGAGYDHHHYHDEMLAALEVWAAHVGRLVSPSGATVLR